MKLFSILSNGLVQGGSASYSVDPLGVITYQASVRIGKFFLSKTYSSQGTYKIDPATLNPSNLAVGKVITIGSLVMTVVSLLGSQAVVSLAVIGQQATGTATLLTDSPVVVLSTLDATVSVYGFNLQLGLRPV
jgi:hypothetical protein